MSKLIAYAEAGIAHPLFVLERASDGFFWHVGSAAWEAYDAARVAGYGVAASATVPGRYEAANPAPADAALYRFVAAGAAALSAADLADNLNVRAVGESEAPVNFQAITDLVNAVKAKTDLLGTSAAPVLTSPLSADGYTVSLFRRDDYQTDDGRGIIWTDTAGRWPYNFLGASVRLELNADGSRFWPMDVVSDAAPRSIRLTLTALQTATLSDVNQKGRVVLTTALGRRITLFRLSLNEL